MRILMMTAITARRGRGMAWQSGLPCSWPNRRRCGIIGSTERIELQLFCTGGCIDWSVYGCVPVYLHKSGRPSRKLLSGLVSACYPREKHTVECLSMPGHTTR